MADPGSTAIGVLSGVLGIVDFIKGLFPDKPVDMGATVRVKVGLGDENSGELGGTINAIYGFDSNNDYLGDSIAYSIGAGDFADFTIRQMDTGRRADFISVASSEDAVCIEWITINNLDGTLGGAWNGDVGFACGTQFYYGNQVAGKYPNGTDWSPYCAWIDDDGTNGITTRAFKFTSDAYGSELNATLSAQQGCSASILMSAVNGPIPGRPAGNVGNGPHKSRDLSTVRKRPASTEDRLIISKKPFQTAEELCNHPNSLGPDFIGVDNKFCDMKNKILSPLCSLDEVDGCVEISDKTLTRRTSVARRTADIVHKTYRLVSSWS